MLRRIRWPSQRKPVAASADVVFDAASCRHLLSVREGAAVRRFAVDLRVCTNPCCPCWIVELVCAPDGGAGEESEPSRRIALDVLDREAARPAGGAPGHDCALARAVAEGMSDAGWTLLVSHLYDVKREQMRTMDLDSLDVRFPCEVMAGDGTMSGYAEIFPFADPFRFDLDADEWAVDDQYCVNPTCKCHDVALTFLQPLGDGATADALGDPPELPTVRYDYRRGSHEVLVEPTKPAPWFSELLTALRRAHPGVGRAFEERHRRLRYLFGRATRQQDGGGQAQPVSRLKIGRNEPCPCGSGKKYKRCCGR